MLYNFEFDSDRKRSSVVVRSVADGKLLVLVKGADNVMKGIMAQPYEHLKDMDCFLDDFSKAGLRTLCLGYKLLEPGTLTEFTERYSQAYQKGDRESQAEAVGAVESEVLLLGCTGIEDRLQDNVGKVMTDMRMAGIKVWMLTGDKLETAENIGRSCGLIAMGS